LKKSFPRFLILDEKEIRVQFKEDIIAVFAFISSPI
jgi:hypothetical protein